MKQTERRRAALGLYIHVPFCAVKCSYCDFYSLSGQNEHAVEQYIQAVCEHIRQYGRVSTGYYVDTIYFGGGTPSYLGAKNLIRMLTEIRKTFQVDKGAEITVECNPDSMDKRLLRALKRAGVNRLSVGVQSAHNDELRRLGRAHTWEQAYDALTLAKKIGFANISIDLMYGLPEQTLEDFMQSVRAVLDLQPAHLSCYGLKLEPNTPMGQQNPVLPDDDTQAEVYLLLCQRLREAGYAHYEISNWARGGYHSRHNSKYWDLSPYLGLGPGAHSYFGEQRFAFTRNLEAYCTGLQPDGSPILEQEEDIPTMQRHGEYIMLRLRTKEGLKEQVFEQLFKRDFAPYEAKLMPLAEAGLVQNEAGRWFLTERGFFVSNTIICEVLSADDPETNITETEQ